MTDCRLDVLCIGNAIVDVIANATDDFLAAEGLVKGSMRLIDPEEAERLYSHMGPAHQVSGCAHAAYRPQGLRLALERMAQPIERMLWGFPERFLSGGLELDDHALGERLGSREGGQGHGPRGRRQDE